MRRAPQLNQRLHYPSGGHRVVLPCAVFSQERKRNEEVAPDLDIWVEPVESSRMTAPHRLGLRGRLQQSSNVPAEAREFGGPPVVLLVQDLDGGGGMETVLRRQLPSLARSDDVQVVAYSMPVELIGLVGWTRVPWLPGPGWARTLWYSLIVTMWLPMIKRRLRRSTGLRPTVWSTGGLVFSQVDVVTLHFLHAAFVAANGWAPGHRGARRVNAAWARLIGLLLERWTCTKSRDAEFTVVSSGLEREFRQQYPGRRCTVTPNGVDVPATARNLTDADYGPLRAIFIGGDWVRKGLPIVLEAVSRSPDVRLSVVGDGPAHIGPKNVDRLGISARVTFHGWQPDVSEYLREADVFVFPSQYETFGLAAFEAAAAGLAVVATPVGAISELVLEGTTGILVEPGDPLTLSAALNRLSDDRDLCERLGAAARERAAAFSWDASIESIGKILRDRAANRN